MTDNVNFERILGEVAEVTDAEIERAEPENPVSSSEQIVGILEDRDVRALFYLSSVKKFFHSGSELALAEAELVRVAFWLFISKIFPSTIEKNVGIRKGWRVVILQERCSYVPPGIEEIMEFFSRMHGESTNPRTN